MSERLDLDVDGERTEAVPTRRPSARVPALDDDRPADPDVEEVLEAGADLPADEQEVPLDDEP
ncbi:MAG: hypothetical protein ACRD0A_01850 [Acidimicrobiales bacterium]